MPENFSELTDEEQAEALASPQGIPTTEKLRDDRGTNAAALNDAAAAAEERMRANREAYCPRCTSG